MRNRMSLGLSALALAGVTFAATGGCNTHAVEPFSENLVAERIESVNVGGANKVDILWIVDNSGSMCEEQESLKENFGSFMQGLIEVGVDFQMSVITTDMEDPLEAGRFQNIPDGATGPSCDLEIDVSGCAGDLPLIMKSSDPRYLDPSGKINVASVQQDFGCIATTGTQGSGFEMGLEAAKTALSAPLITTGSNAGFLRDDAFLAVIFITDENDCSDRGALEKVNGNVCEWEESKLVPVQEYIDFFGNLKGTQDRVIMAGIVSPDNGIRYAYGDEVAPSCVTDTGRGFSSYRYQQLIDAFPLKSSANICEPPFDNALKAIGDLLVEALDNKCLDASPPTCETNDDCNGDACTERGGLGVKYCEAFKVQVEVLRSEATPDLEGRECVAAGTGNRRCILNEGEGNDFVIEYGVIDDCPGSGITINLLYELTGADELVVRYPKKIADEAQPTVTTPAEEDPGN